MIIHLA